jgi:hypothetical protein
VITTLILILPSITISIIVAEQNVVCIAAAATLAHRCIDCEIDAVYITAVIRAPVDCTGDVGDGGGNVTGLLGRGGCGGGKAQCGQRQEAASVHDVDAAIV